MSQPRLEKQRRTCPLTTWDIFHLFFTFHLQPEIIKYYIFITERRTMSCTICGAGVELPPKHGKGDWWLAQAVMLSDPAEEFETLEQHYHAGKKPGVPELDFAGDGQEIQRDEVTVALSGECILKKDGRRVWPKRGIGLDESGERHPDSTAYGIVVHEACLDIVDRAMQKSWRHLHARSMRTLWKVLRMRLDAFDNKWNWMRGPRNDSDLEVHDIGQDFYYTFEHHSAVLVIDRRQLASRTRAQADRHMWLLEDPTTTPDLKDMLLASYKPVKPRPANAEADRFRNLFLSLPSELRHLILMHLSSYDDLHLSWTGLLPQEIWRDMLLGKEFLPFLHDMDEAALSRFAQEQEETRRREQGTDEPEMEIDWESLVRRLSRGALGAEDGLLLLRPAGVLRTAEPPADLAVGGGDVRRRPGAIEGQRRERAAVLGRVWRAGAPRRSGVRVSSKTVWCV
ncbi:hypothetical protein PG997_002557 [Apiospora hydei]|uniref:F-box domain-containing protein n=1 Tax=Apiospora hydei TaxID=1337664 RepID=A0ABR1WWS3_9PEZI